MKPTAHMPPELAKRLIAFERRLRILETGTALLAGVAGALATLILLALLDRFVDTPPALRMALTVGGALAAGFAVTWWVHHWLWRRRDARALARLVQRQYPKLGDRLLGAVELSGDEAEQTGASPALLRAALRQVAHEAEAYDFQQAAPTRALRYYALAFLLMALLLVAGITWAPDALRQSVQRWLRPGADIDRYTFVQLSDLPDEIVVPHGEPFDVACRVDPGSRWMPVRGQARIERQPPVRAHIRGGVARFDFPGQLEDGELTIRIGDARRTLTVRPRHRPELTDVLAHIEWPDYLQREPETRRVDRGRISLLDSARVSFTGQATRDIESAHILRVDVPDAEEASLTVTGNIFETTWQLVTDWIEHYPFDDTTNTASALFTWADPTGMREARPFRLRMQAERDRLPVIRLDGITRAIAILPQEVVTITTRAEDDYGLAAVGLDWTLYTPEITDEGQGMAMRATRELTLAEDDSGATQRMNVEHRISPTLLSAEPGEWIMLQAWAEDHHPDHERVRTQPVYIQIYSYEEHAQLILQAMQRLSDRLEDVVRQEESLLATHEALATLDDAALDLARTEQLLQQGEQGEHRNIMDTLQLAMDVDQLMQEALRNPELEAGVIQPWLDAAERMRQAVESAMTPAAQALANAQEQSENRRSELEEAARNEQAAVDQLRQAAQNMQQAMDLAQARNFVNRLRELARQERDVGTRIANNIPDWIGLRTEELDPDARIALTSMQRVQESVRQEALYVRDDLGAFFVRTREPLYETVRREMAEPDVSQEITAAADALSQNLLITVSPVIHELVDKFERWAGMLEVVCDAGGGDGDGGGEDALEQEVLIGLMRARVWEEMLREQTRALSQATRDGNFFEGAHTAAERQHDIGDELLRLSEITERQDVAQWIQQLVGISDEVAGLLRKHEAGAPTIGGQTEIIEAIAQAIQSQGASAEASPGEGDAEAAQAGAAAGMGGTGGDSSGTGVQDGPGAGEPETRSGERGSGDPATWPHEYRDAIQRYYEAMETTP